MKNRRIEVGISLTKNLGNIEFTKIIAGTSGDIGRKENRDEEWDKAWKEVELQMSQELEKIVSIFSNR